jgi:hypothetical protein
MAWLWSSGSTVPACSFGAANIFEPLRSVYRRFTEGFGLADLQEAKSLFAPLP